MAGAARVIVAGLVLVLALLVGTAIVDELTADEPGLTGQERDTVTFSQNDSFVQVNDGKGTDETVWKTRGYAVNLTGSSDSFVETADAVTFTSDKNWTVSVWARVDAGSAANDMSVLSANGRLAIWYDGSNSQWSAWYYDEGERNSYRVNVSAPNQPQTYSNVFVRANDTDLSIWRNGTVGETTDITVTNTEPAPTFGNFDGRLEELRVFDEPLDATNRSELVNSPVEQQPDTDRTARVMFDENKASAQTVLFASTTMTQSNVSFSAGFPAQQMQRSTITNDLAGTSDYAWDVDGPRISALSTGELAGAPVAYVDYTFEDALQSVVDGWGSFVGVAALAPLILIAAFILSRLRD